MLLRTKTAVLKDAARHEFQGQNSERVSAATQLKAAEIQPTNIAFLRSISVLVVFMFHFLCALEWICVQYLIC